MDEDTRRHLDKVRQWLKENVKSYPTPKQVTLSSFHVNWSNLSGSFKVALDEIALLDRLAFSVDQSGRAKFNLPIFHSPLSMPASYESIELTDITLKAILEGLRKAIPRVMACGINNPLGKEIVYFTPINDRIINLDEFEALRAMTSHPDYSITVQTLTT